MLKIRRPLGRLIFNMGIAIPGKTVFLIETAPWSYLDNIFEYWITMSLILVLNADQLGWLKRYLRAVTKMRIVVSPNEYTLLIHDGPLF